MYHFLPFYCCCSYSSSSVLMHLLLVGLLVRLSTHSCLLELGWQSGRRKTLTKRVRRRRLNKRIRRLIIFFRAKIDNGVDKWECILRLYFLRYINLFTVVENNFIIFFGGVTNLRSLRQHLLFIDYIEISI